MEALPRLELEIYGNTVEIFWKLRFCDTESETATALPENPMKLGPKSKPNRKLHLIPTACQCVRDGLHPGASGRFFHQV